MDRVRPSRNTDPEADPSQDNLYLSLQSYSRDWEQLDTEPHTVPYSLLNFMEESTGDINILSGHDFLKLLFLTLVSEVVLPRDATWGAVTSASSL